MHTMYFLVLLIGSATSSPVTRTVRDTVSPNLVLVNAREGISRPEPRQDTQEEDISLPAGQALDLFYRFGFFSLSVRVVPRDDAGSWVIREPTADIFAPGSVRQVTLPQSNKFQDQFQIFFCDSLEDLMKHYFHDFHAEGVKQPYRMFTGSWRNPTIANYFGLSEETLHSEMGFVLVKLVRPKVTMRIEGNPQLEETAQAEFNKIRVGDRDSVEKFVKNYGSHYIKSLTVGDAVYQILALDNPTYNRAKNDVLVTRKVTDFNQIYDEYLAPWLVKDNGKILLASGDQRTGAFLSSRVVKTAQFTAYPSIFEIRRQPELLDELEFLTRGTTAVIALDFKSLGSLLPEVQKQDFYKEVVNTQLALWEVNI